MFTNPSHPLLAHDILARTTVISAFTVTTSKLVLRVVSAVFLFKLVAGVWRQLEEVQDILARTTVINVFPVTTSKLALCVVSVVFLFLPTLHIHS